VANQVGCNSETSSSQQRQTVKSKSIAILWISDTQPLDVFLHKTSLVHIVTQFAEMGHKVTLIGVRSRDPFQIENSKAGIILFPLRFVHLISPIMYAIVLFLFLPFSALISKQDRIIIEYDISVLSSLFPLLISRIRKTKLILDIRSIPVEMAGFRGFLHSLKFSVAVLVAKKFFDGITILTPSMKDDLCSKFNLNPRKVGVWTSGVSQNMFDPQKLKSESAQLKTKLGLDGRFVVFYHGILTATRGLQETVEAMKKLRVKYSNITFFLLGSGPIASDLKTLVVEKNLQDAVIIHDAVEQSSVPKFIGMCDVGIVPLPYHAFWRFQSPLKLLEYLSMEKTVIVSDITAHRSIIGDRKCGIYISNVEPDEISKAIEYAYNNWEQLEEWGRIGRKIIKEEYTWEEVSKDLERYLISLDTAC
jgi:glycosyltransferase involved in cell wall biosynthesis